MKKTMISIRLDTEVLVWLRHNFSKGYQTKVNEILQSFKTNCENREERLIGRAQEIYNHYHAQCFWHLQRDLIITAAHLPLIREGLKKYGGRIGYQLASELSDKKG